MQSSSRRHSDLHRRVNIGVVGVGLPTVSASPKCGTLVMRRHLLGRECLVVGQRPFRFLHSRPQNATARSALPRGHERCDFECPLTRYCRSLNNEQSRSFTAAWPSVCTSASKAQNVRSKCERNLCEESEAVVNIDGWNRPKSSRLSLPQDFPDSRRPNDGPGSPPAGAVPGQNARSAGTICGSRLQHYRGGVYR
jgi:hypothetical protein